MIQSISLSWLHSYSSLEEALLPYYPKSTLKKFLSRKQLNLKIKEGREMSLPLALLNCKEINPKYLGEDISILFEDEFLLAFEKPAGVHGHPLTYAEENTALNWLASRSPALLQVNNQQQERGLLYRLDAETSGVMVYIKNEEDHKQLRLQFHSLVTEKIYETQVEGEFPSLDILRHKLKSSGPKGLKMIEAEDGDECQLEILEVQHHQKMSHLKIKLKEGRRHQVRAQLSAIGFPILGDTLYGGRESERLHLHARKYSLSWKKDYEFISEAKAFSLAP